MNKEQGEAHPVTSSDVNAYIREATGEDFTAKHFRTWAASVIAFEALASAERDLSLKALIAPVTEKLGNTPAIARPSSAHPSNITPGKPGQAKFTEQLRFPRPTPPLTPNQPGLIPFP